MFILGIVDLDYKQHSFSVSSCDCYCLPYNTTIYLKAKRRSVARSASNLLKYRRIRLYNLQAMNRHAKMIYRANKPDLEVIVLEWWVAVHRLRSTEWGRDTRKSQKQPSCNLVLGKIDAWAMIPGATVHSVSKPGPKALISYWAWLV